MRCLQHHGNRSPAASSPEKGKAQQGLDWAPFRARQAGPAHHPRYATGSPDQAPAALARDTATLLASRAMTTGRRTAGSQGAPSASGTRRSGEAPSPAAIPPGDRIGHSATFAVSTAGPRVSGLTGAIQASVSSTTVRSYGMKSGGTREPARVQTSLPPHRTGQSERLHHWSASASWQRIIGVPREVGQERVTFGDQRPALKKDVKPSAQAARAPGGHWRGVGACRKGGEDPQPRLFSDMAREGDSGRPLRHRRRRRYRRPRPVLRAEAWPGCR